MDKRKKALTHWVATCYPKQRFDIESLAGDASFRRYFRLQFDDKRLVAMDAPPPQEEIMPFVQIAQAMKAHRVSCPEVLHYDIERGFLLLSDLGDNLLLNAIDTTNADGLYHCAIDGLLRFQSIKTIDNYVIPEFDESHIRYELNLFEQWFLAEYLSISLSDEERQQLKTVFNVLVEQLEQQPKTLIHRDYHSRNLMLSQDQDLHIIDFQDAMIGPYSYDIISLLKDCYIAWPEQKRIEWLDYYRQKLAVTVSLERMMRDADFCGIQRHIKVLGIFSRLYLRDEKSHYLKNLPLTLKYLCDAAEKYKEFDDLTKILKQIRLP